MKIPSALWMTTLVALTAVSCGGRVRGGTGNSTTSNGGSGSTSGSNGGGSAGAITTAPCEAMVDAGRPPVADARVPLEHRSSACCTSPRGPGSTEQPYPPGIAASSPDGGVACSSDSQCVSGTNGRCFPNEGLVGPGGCSYDECATDSDCPSGTPCGCRASPGDNAANVCAPGGNCVVDSDCGPGGYCSPSREDCNGPSPYFCHTALDACVNDADCLSVDAGANFGITSKLCSYDHESHYWSCKQFVCNPP